MPFDALAMTAVTDELRDALVGGQIQRIIQPGLHSVALAVYAGGRRHWLLISVDPERARLVIVPERLAKAFPTPSGFVMLLRKHLEGGRVRDVIQIPHERVGHIRCGVGGAEYTLAVEIMGRHSNVLLVDGSGTVLGALKLVSLLQSRVRPVRPGVAYAPPPARPRAIDLFGEGSRPDPVEHPGRFAELLREAPANTPLSRALLGLVPGAGPFICRQIALRAGVPASMPREAVEPDSVTEAAAALLRLGRSHDWHPCSFVDDRGRQDFAPYQPLGVASITRHETISAAIGAASDDDLSRDPLAPARKALLGDIERARRGAAGRIHSLEAGLEAADRADDLMTQGRLILAYAHTVERGATQLDLPDFGIAIPLDSSRTASENAERLFRRYRKLRDARTRIPPLLAEAQIEVDRLTEIAAFVPLAMSESDLKAVRLELRNGEPEAIRSTKRSRRHGPPRYRQGNWTAIAGRTARENEVVTFRLAGRDHVWLHARGRPGAHVVLQSPKDEVPEDVLASAAALAAYLSSGREDTAVDVDIVAVRDVRKLRASPPGRVTYRNERTVRVQPAIAGWTRT